MRFGIWDYKAKSGRDSGLKLCAGDEIPKIPLGIMGLHEIWVGITGLKIPIGDSPRGERGETAVFTGYLK